MSRCGRLAAGIVAVVAFACALPGAAVASGRPDPLLEQQWPLGHKGTLDRAAAWRQSTGAGALVAILDTGAEFAHPDLQGAFWTNPGEIAGNGVDDDRDGVVDDVHGADLVNGDGDPSDDEGHGTHVAGIIAARAGNGIGGAGLAPNATIMIVKVLDNHRAGTAAVLAQGIRYAVAHGARIINTSVNGDGTSRQLQDAIAEAGAAGALVIASAGNDGRDIDAAPSYPASYTDPAIVSVAALEKAGALSSFSNRGAGSVDIAAPGEDVLSTAFDNGYELRSGTSMAAPFVSATLALLQSVRPSLDDAALKAALVTGARPSALLTGLVKAGSLDAAGSLRVVLGAAPVAPVAPVAVASVGALSASSLPVRRAVGGAIIAWSLAGDTAGVASVRVTVDGRTVAVRPAAVRDSLRVHAPVGVHRWAAIAVDSAGTRLTAAQGRFRVATHGARHRSNG